MPYNYPDNTYIADPRLCFRELYFGAVHIKADAANVAITFPNGSPKLPVSSFAAAHSIAEWLNLNEIMMISSTTGTTLTDELATRGYRIIGAGCRSSFITLVDSNLCPGSYFKGLGITGTVQNGYGDHCFEDCYVYGFTSTQQTKFLNCELQNIIVISEKNILVGCYPSRYGSGIVEIHGRTNSVPSAVINCSGNWILKNWNGGNENFAVVNHNGTFTIDSTVTYTNFKIYGACSVVNNGGVGVTVDYLPFAAFSATDVWSAAIRTLTAPVDLIDSLKHKAGSSGYDRTTDSLEAIGEKLVDGTRDFTNAEVAQVRDALGITGTKTAATGGQLQAKLEKNDFVDFQNKTVLSRNAGNPATYKIGTGVNEKTVTASYVDVGGGDLRVETEAVA